jgi:hypothetical protein
MSRSILLRRKPRKKCLVVLFSQSDKERYGPMLVTLENDNTTGRNACPDTRKAAFGFLNKWSTTYERRSTMEVEAII